MDGLELGEVGPDRDRLVAVRRCAPSSRARNSLPARRPFAVRVKKRNCFGSWRVSSPRTVSRCESRVTLLMPSPPAGPVPARISLRTSCGSSLRDHLGDHAAHREAEEVDLLEAERPDEGDGVVRHRLDGVRRRAGGGADAAVVEGDDPVLRGDAVDDSGVPVVQDRGQVGEEDHRDAGRSGRARGRRTRRRRVRSASAQSPMSCRCVLWVLDLRHCASGRGS